MDTIDYAEILKMVSLIHRKTQIHLSQQTQLLELTQGQVPFIILTCQNGKMGQNRFCELLDMSKGAVAKTIAKLEEEGYVKREENPQDGRSIDVYPTEKAKEIYPVLVQVGDDWVVQMLKGMTKLEQSIFFQMLSKVVGNISESFELAEHAMQIKE